MNNKKLENKEDRQYNSLVTTIGNILQKGKTKFARVVNNVIVHTYWQIGRQIVEFEQKGNIKAEYGSNVLNRLSKDLTIRYGKGFSHSNVVYIRKLYLSYPKSQTLSDQLTWSHYIELLMIENPLERSFYEKECLKNNWGVRELKRQKKSLLFHRLALSTEKNDVLRLAEKGQIIESPEDIIKDPYIFEFTNLPSLPVYKEGDIEEALVNHLSQFLLELGKGFTYVGRQQKILIAGRTYKIDLVFYHRILKCFVLIDLKRGMIQHEDIGQMNFYLNYYKSEMNTEGDTEPIGIVLGSENDKLVMQYALQGITNKLFVSRYQLYLPNKNQLELELQRFLNDKNNKKN